MVKTLQTLKKEIQTMKRTFILACVVTTSLCYGMEKKDTLCIKKINNPKDIEKGLKLVWDFFEKLHGKPISEELQAHRAKRLPHLVGLLNENCLNAIFVKKGNEVVGFGASHICKEDKTRVILDNAFPGSKEIQAQVVPKLLGFIAKTYPNAKTVWAAVDKYGENSVKLMEQKGFKKSDYMDQFHKNSEAAWQGWEQPMLQKEKE